MTDEDRQRIYEEEKARFEAREELEREKSKDEVKSTPVRFSSGPVWTAGDASQAIGCIVTVPIVLGLPLIWTYISPSFEFGLWAGLVWIAIWIGVGIKMMGLDINKFK